MNELARQESTPSTTVQPDRWTSDSLQKGIVLPIFAAAALALIAMAGLALDTSHVMLNKTRLQNTVDAAALSAAKTLDQTGDTADATAAAIAVFAQNAHAPGNKELAKFFDAGGNIEVLYSNTLYPFSPGTEPAQYARVYVADFPLDTWIVGALGITEKSVAASAVGGPSPPLGVDDIVCKLAPMMVCGDPADPGETHFGYTLGDVQVLKSTTVNGDWEVGPGNFQLVRLSTGQGGAAIREAMAGGHDACNESTNNVDTEPGNTVGPVVQGLNTRFGDHTGVMNGTEAKYPPDVVVTENSVEIQFDANGNVVTQPGDLDFNIDNYEAQIEDGNYDYTPAPAGPGHFERRVIALPIGDCSTTVNGQGQVPLLGYGCFFLTQKAEHQGNESSVYGQFVESCAAGGVPGPNPGGGPGGTGVGPHIIQLYEDPSSTDS